MNIEQIKTPMDIVAYLSDGDEKKQALVVELIIAVIKGALIGAEEHLGMKENKLTDAFGASDMMAAFATVADVPFVKRMKPSTAQGFITMVQEATDGWKKKVQNGEVRKKEKLRYEEIGEMELTPESSVDLDERKRVNDPNRKQIDLSFLESDEDDPIEMLKDLLSRITKFKDDNLPNKN